MPYVAMIHYVPDGDYVVSPFCPAVADKAAMFVKSEDDDLMVALQDISNQINDAVKKD